MEFVLDKYAKVLDDSYMKSSNAGANKSGLFSLDIENTSTQGLDYYLQFKLI